MGKWTCAKWAQVQPFGNIKQLELEDIELTSKDSKENTHD